MTTTNNANKKAKRVQVGDKSCFKVWTVKVYFPDGGKWVSEKMTLAEAEAIEADAQSQGYGTDKYLD